jgi:hypothetical protein
MTTKKLPVLIMAMAAAALLSGCVRYDPYTGRQEIDYGATAGVVGLALGAAALGVVAANGPHGPGFGPPPLGYHHGPGPGFRPGPGPGPGFRPGPVPGFRPGPRPPY